MTAHGSWKSEFPVADRLRSSQVTLPSTFDFPMSRGKLRELRSDRKSFLRMRQILPVHEIQVDVADHWLKTEMISELNTQPGPSPVNASIRGMPHELYHSGPKRLAE